MMNGIEKARGEIVMYQPDETIKLEVRLEDETVWLTQAQMAELFQKDQSVIARHIGNVFREGELQETSNMQILHNTLSKFKPTKIYNLNVIISVGYRVKSKRGTQFRIWATSVLKELLLRDLLDVRSTGVQATIYTEQLTLSLQRLVQLHNQEYPSSPVNVFACTRPFHDRFLIIDDELWHCGASFKDLGRKLFAIDKLCIDKNIILSQL